MSQRSRDSFIAGFREKMQEYWTSDIDIYDFKMLAYDFLMPYCCTVVMLTSNETNFNNYTRNDD